MLYSFNTATLSMHSKHRGGDLGTVPQNLRWGNVPCIRPPNILRSSVVGCAGNHEKSKKVVFFVRKGSYTTFNRVKIRKIWGKKGKIRKTWSMIKKGSSEIFAVKMKIVFQ